MNVWVNKPMLSTLETIGVSQVKIVSEPLVELVEIFFCRECR